MKQIKRIGVWQTAKIIAVLSGILSAVFIVPLSLVAIFSGQKNLIGGISLLIFPLLYTALGFIITAIGCFVYNAVAERIGGIEIKL